MPGCGKISEKDSKEVGETNLTAEDLDWLSRHFLEELCSKHEVEDTAEKTKIMQTARECNVKVQPGVIRHTSSPCRPLAYYYLRQ